MIRIRPVLRAPALLAVMALALSACTSTADLKEPPVDMGDFALGLNVVVASKMKKGPLSRDATEEEWQQAIKAAIAERFGRYDGDKLIDFGISVEGYMLAEPGIPIILSPKSALIVRVTLWDDAHRGKINSPAKQFIVLETLSKKTLIGSGHTMTAQEQMTELARNAAKQIQNWILEHPEWLDAKTNAVGLGYEDKDAGKAAADAGVAESDSDDSGATTSDSTARGQTPAIAGLLGPAGVVSQLAQGAQAQ